MSNATSAIVGLPERVGSLLQETWRVTASRLEVEAIDITPKRIRRLISAKGPQTFDILTSDKKTARIANYPIVPAFSVDRRAAGAQDDLTAGGTYTGSQAATYTVVIADGTVNPDTFKWKKDNGSFSAPANIVGGAITLSDGVTITFGAVNGHATGDTWIITAEPATFQFDVTLQGYGG